MERQSGLLVPANFTPLPHFSATIQVPNATANARAFSVAAGLIGTMSLAPTKPDLG
jgi:hypothetical protein